MIAEQIVFISNHETDDSTILTTNSDQANDILLDHTPVIKHSYLPIGLLYGFYYIIFTLVIPALPALTLKLENDEASTAAYLYGLANFVRYIVEFFCAPVLGNLTDIYGRRIMLCISFAVCGIEFALLAICPSIAMIFISRAMSGAFDSALPTSYTIVTDIAFYNHDNVTTKYGLLGAVSGLGYIVGPLLGGILCEINLSLCFFVASGLSVLGLILTLLILPETLVLSSKPGLENESELTKLRPWNPFPALRLHFQSKELRQLTIPLAISSLNLGIGAIWYIYMAYRYNATSTEIGIYMSFFGVVSAIIQGILIKYLIPKVWCEQTACVFGFYLLAVQYCAYGLSPWQIGLYVAVLLFTIGMVSDPALKALIVQASLRKQVVDGEARTTNYHYQGNLQGVLCSIRTLGNAFGALIFASIYGYSISMHPSLPFVAFVIGGLLYAICGAYLQYLFRSHNTNTDDVKNYTEVDIDERLLPEDNEDYRII